MNKKKASLLTRARLFFAAKKHTLKFAQIETNAGTLIYDGDIEVGKEVTLATENNEPIIAPDGEYREVGGNERIIIVENGVIASYTDPMDERVMPEMEVQENTVTAVEIVTDEVSEIVEKVADMFDTLQDKIDELENKVEEVSMELSKQKEVNLTLSKEVDEIAKMPAATPIKNNAQKMHKNERRDLTRFGIKD